MAGGYPTFREGMGLRDFKAREMQKMSDAAKRFDNMKVAAPMYLRNTPAGVRLGIRTARKIGAAAGGGGTVAPFVLTGMSKDHVLAEPLGGGDEIKIAKPYKLRQNPFHGQTLDGKDYVYFNSTQRRVSLAGTDVGETQVVIPAYRIPPRDDRGDLIWAVEAVTVMDYGLGGLNPPLVPEELDWLDINVDGRAWAQESTG